MVRALCHKQLISKHSPVCQILHNLRSPYCFDIIGMFSKHMFNDESSQIVRSVFDDQLHQTRDDVINSFVFDILLNLLVYLGGLNCPLMSVIVHSTHERMSLHNWNSTPFCWYWLLGAALIITPAFYSFKRCKPFIEEQMKTIQRRYFCSMKCLNTFLISRA